jgi:NADH:ubiquinone oxidoreductase subunit 5 (subunit L)/multisubunit Na+/H+ antiporter MnhA subunit
LGSTIAGKAASEVHLGTSWGILLFDPLSTLMAFVVSGISLLVHVYSVRYMAEERGYSRFFVLLDLMTAALLLMVSAGDLITLLVAWHLIGAANGPAAPGATAGDSGVDWPGRKAAVLDGMVGGGNGHPLRPADSDPARSGPVDRVHGDLRLGTAVVSGDLRHLHCRRYCVDLPGPRAQCSLALLAWLAGRLESELGAAYAGLCGGLAQTLPRLSGMLVLGMLAAVATPLVPGFFTLLVTAIHALPASLGIALVILTVWLLWAWGGARILREFVVGPACADPKRDIGTTATVLLGLTFVVLVLAGISLSGEMT